MTGWWGYLSLGMIISVVHKFNQQMDFSNAMVAMILGSAIGQIVFAIAEGRH